MKPTKTSKTNSKTASSKPQVTGASSQSQRQPGGTASKCLQFDSSWEASTLSRSSNKTVMPR